MRIIQSDDVRAWYEAAGVFSTLRQSVGHKHADPEYLDRVLGIPLHLRFVVEQLALERPGADLSSALDSIPFYSLCRGLFLPLSGLAPEKTAQLFGLVTPPPPDAASRQALVGRFLAQPLGPGLGLEEKLGCILGDPFLGRPSTVRRDSLLRLLGSLELVSRASLLDRLTRVGDVAVLFAESRRGLRALPLLSAAEVLCALRFLPAERRNFRFELLRSLLGRAGKLEAYFLAKLLLRRAGFGFDYQGPLIAHALAERFAVAAEAVEQAIALSDVFQVARVLANSGEAGLRRIQLQPLAPVRPALASGTVDEIRGFPVWVERKYDGIRLMLHKSTDSGGAVLCGAYTRNRGDWLESVPGLGQTIRLLPCRSAIVDGELWGKLLDLDGARPASVYEVHAAVQGERPSSLSLRFAAFDLIYLDGHDLSRLPLAERRARLAALLAPLAALPLPVPLTIAEGQLAQSREDVNRLYQHFRAQGYEGIVAKDPAGPYRMAQRDPAWHKRKPEITLDLVLTAAVYAVTGKQHAALFGSYVIAARKQAAEGGFEEVGDVAGVDRVRDAEIQAEILRQGLVTGQRIERPSASGVRPGLVLRPHIVVTVKFEGVTRDTASGKLSLRDPKLVVIRSDKSAGEADSTSAIEELYLRQRVG